MLNENDRVVFWRIIFDVVDHKIRLREELTCWEFLGSASPAWRRLNREIHELPCNPVGPRGAVVVHEDYVEFRGGYLVSQTHDIREYQQQWLRGQANVGSKTFDGENVSIRAEVMLAPDQVQRDNPIFHIPRQHVFSGGIQIVPGQPPAGSNLQIERTLDPVTLSEWSGSTDERRISWEIAGRPDQSPEAFDLNPFEGWHRIRVHQDDVHNLGDGFEFRVDSVPLGFLPLVNAGYNLDETKENPTFIFNPTSQPFFIGGMPDENGVLFGLHGAISYLEFDPNDSCRKCLVE